MVFEPRRAARSGPGPSPDIADRTADQCFVAFEAGQTVGTASSFETDRDHMADGNVAS